jgi:signal transduction histidine kinase
MTLNRTLDELVAKQELTSPYKNEGKDTILIVDDDLNILQAYSMYLGNDYEIIAASTEQQAKSGFNRAYNRLKLILMDVMINENDFKLIENEQSDPDKPFQPTGIRLCEYFKEKNQDIPLILYSAYSERLDLSVIAHRFPPDAFIEKGTPLSANIEKSVEMHLYTIKTAIENYNRRLVRERLKEQTTIIYNHNQTMRLIGGIIHDIGNQINIIVGYAELTEIVIENFKKIYPGESFIKLDKYKQGIQIGIENTIRLTKNGMSLALQENIEYEDINLKKTIDFCIEMLSVNKEYTVQLPHISIINNINPNLTFRAHKMDFTQVGLNLLQNSIHAVFYEKEDKKKIDVTASNEEEYISLKVYDTGCGIPSEIINRISEPGFSTKPQKSDNDIKPITKGGLGMTSVYAIAKQYNGKIDIKSEPGSYTSITISFKKDKLK